MKIYPTSISVDQFSQRRANNQYHTHQSHPLILIYSPGEDKEINTIQSEVDMNSPTNKTWNVVKKRQIVLNVAVEVFLDVSLLVSLDVVIFSSQGKKHIMQTNFQQIIISLTMKSKILQIHM